MHERSEKIRIKNFLQELVQQTTPVFKSLPFMQKLIKKQQVVYAGSIPASCVKGDLNGTV